MKRNLLKSALVLSALAVLLGAAGCDEDPAKKKIIDESEVVEKTSETSLDTPANVTIMVTGRTMAVTWSAVNDAEGYEIFTTSENCGSGNKIINTKDNTATRHDGTGSYIKDDKSNGAVEIKSNTSIEITLMPKAGDTTKPMATSVTAKVKALGGLNLNDSSYSEVETCNISDGM
ncbi:MAG: hypothetical protein LBV17_10595 [Treponema sp.]|jgi:hypothetical protein|nr:hypothetical protein [Treponema sp.]